MIKVFCIPHAGASATIYSKWQSYSTKGMEFIPIELQGRGKRYEEGPYETWIEAVEDVYASISSQIDPQTKYALFGHSMGGLLVYYVSKNIYSSLQNKPIHLFFSGSNPPHIITDKKILSLSVNGFKEELIKMGGTSKEIFENSKQDNDKVLKNVTLCVERGKRTAIVGPSGAGKSTILQLIERFYDPNGGEIYINGVNYRNYTREELRKLITYVEQDAPVVSGTLRENLLLGNTKATDKECLKVMNEVNLDHLLERSSKGLDAQVGEGGARLSGGERQRLAMARSLLSSAEIVLLDELTSNLDSINEIGMKKAVDRMKGIKTVIIVAHRLSTVVDSDSIYVLEHGRVVGTGSHNELLEKVPLYRELAKEQFVDVQI